MLADLQLQQLQCKQQSDGSNGCNPYLWVVLLRIDDDTLNASPPDAAIFPQDPSAQRLVIQTAMKAGDSAAVPGQINSLVTAISDTSVHRDLIVIAVLLDQHDTSWAAITAGWEQFISTTPAAVGSQLLQLQDPAQQAQAIQAVSNQITTAVTSAIEGQLSWWDKVQIGLGLEKLDRVIAFAYDDWEGVGTATSGPFSLQFTSSTDNFTLNGQLVVTDDPCQLQVAEVQAVQQAIYNIEGRAKELDSGDVNEPPAEVEAELEELAKEMIQERAKLTAAENALNACRAGVVSPIGNAPVSSQPKA
jgi:hypothetical protein